MTVTRRRRANNQAADRHKIITSYIKEFRGLLLAGAAFLYALGHLIAVMIDQ